MADTKAPETGPETTQVASDLADERLIKEQGFARRRQDAAEPAQVR